MKTEISKVQKKVNPEETQQTKNHLPIPAEKNGLELVTIEIPQEVIDLSIKVASENVTWLKLTERGMLPREGETPIPEILGVFTSIKYEYVKWVPGEPPLKVACTGQACPPDHELRAEIKMHTNGGFIGMSLNQTSTRHQLSPYVAWLNSQKLSPEKVITSVKSKTITNAKGRFFITVFALAGDGELLQKETIDPGQVIEITSIGGTPPQPVPQTTDDNPWSY